MRALHRGTSTRWSQPTSPTSRCDVDGSARSLRVDNRITLLDAAARAPRRHRAEEGLRPRSVRLLHRPARRPARDDLPRARGRPRRRARSSPPPGLGDGRRAAPRRRRRSSTTTASSAATARRARSARPSACSTRSRPAHRATSPTTSTAPPELDRRRDPRAHERQPLPLRRLREHRRRHRAGRAEAADDPLRLPARRQTSTDAVAAVAGRPDAVFLAGGTNLVDHMKLGVATPRPARRRRPRCRSTDVEQTARRRRAHRRRRPQQRPRRPSADPQPLSRAGPRAALRRVRAAAQPRHHRRATCCSAPAASTSRTSPRRATSARPAPAARRVGGYVRYHAILGASEHCVAVHPSDMAVAMAALDAAVVVRRRRRRTPHPARPSSTGCPTTSPIGTRCCAHGELITAVELPPPPRRRRSTYRKVRDRASYAFALVSVAAELVIDDGTVRTRRGSRSAVSRTSRGARSLAEEALRGAAGTEDAFRPAADAELDAGRTRCPATSSRSR